MASKSNEGGSSGSKDATAGDKLVKAANARIGSAGAIDQEREAAEEGLGGVLLGDRSG